MYDNSNNDSDITHDFVSSLTKLCGNLVMSSLSPSDLIQTSSMHIEYFTNFPDFCINVTKSRRHITQVSCSLLVSLWKSEQNARKGQIESVNHGNLDLIRDDNGILGRTKIIIWTT